MAAGHVGIAGIDDDRVGTAAGEGGEFVFLGFGFFLGFFLAAGGELLDGAATSSGGDPSRCATALDVVAVTDAAHAPAGQCLGDRRQDQGELQQEKDCELQQSCRF